MRNKFHGILANLKKRGMNGTLSGRVIRLQAEAYAQGYSERMIEFEQLKSELRALQKDMRKLNAKVNEFEKGWVKEFMKQVNGEQE